MSPRIHNGLAAERERRGWSQARAAEAAGVSRQSYAAIEAGRATPSTEVALRLARALGRPVEALFRLPDAPPERVRARWAGSGPCAGRRVRLVRVGGRWVAHPAGEGGRSLAAADGVAGPAADDGEVEVELLPARPPAAALAAVGCDPAFALVSAALRDAGVEAAWSAAGSRAALEALARGEAHVAGCHLRDAGSGDGNEPWIRRLIPFPCTRIAFAVWEQALLVRPGNPAAIGGVADLARPGVRFLNREPGSGSRMLLDEALGRAGVPAERIDGYGTSARGHLAVAEAVASGLADTGVGIVAAGAAFGLDAVSLRSERYELVVPDHFLDLPAVGALLDALRRPGLRAQVEALRGYDTAAMGLPA